MDPQLLYNLLTRFILYNGWRWWLIIGGGGGGNKNSQTYFARWTLTTVILYVFKIKIHGGAYVILLLANYMKFDISIVQVATMLRLQQPVEH